MKATESLKSTKGTSHDENNTRSSSKYASSRHPTFNYSVGSLNDKWIFAKEKVQDSYDANKNLLMLASKVKNKFRPRTTLRKSMIQYRQFVQKLHTEKQSLADTLASANKDCNQLNDEKM